MSLSIGLLRFHCLTTEPNYITFGIEIDWTLVGCAYQHTRGWRRRQKLITYVEEQQNGHIVRIRLDQSAIGHRHRGFFPGITTYSLVLSSQGEVRVYSNGFSTSQIKEYQIWHQRHGIFYNSVIWCFNRRNTLVTLLHN